MKRFVSIAAVALVCSAATWAQAQVIGTYRPSVVTYYPAASATQVGYQQPRVQPVNYAPASYAPANYAPVSYGSTTPISTVGYSQVASRTPLYNTSHIVGSPVGSGCCAPIQSVGYAQGAPCPPIAQTAYAPPVGLPVQAIAAPPPGTIDSQYFIGQGLLGRPKVFKVGQPLRNTVRRILP